FVPTRSVPPRSPCLKSDIDSHQAFQITCTRIGNLQSISVRLEPHFSLVAATDVLARSLISAHHNDGSSSTRHQQSPPPSPPIESVCGAELSAEEERGAKRT